MRLAPLILLAIPFAAFGQGTVPSLNTWTQLNATGYPSTPVGFAKAVYIPTLKVTCQQVNYLTRGVTSEIQDALMCYDYAANRFSVVEQGGGPHSLHSFNGGHEVSVTDYYAAADALVLNSDNSYANQTEVVSDWWVWFATGLTMRDSPIPTSSANSGSLTRTWLNPNQLNMAAINQNTGKMLIVHDFRGQTTSSICAINSLGVLTTCAATSVTGMPTNINSGNLRWNSTDGLFYLWGGGLTAITNYNDVTDTWTTQTTTCTGADCSGTAPPSRQCAGFAYSSTDHLLLLMGGRDLSSGCSSGTGTIFHDTFTYNPSTKVWTELCGPGISACANYPNTSNSTSDSVDYDANSNIFVYLDYPGKVWGFAISTPLGFGRTTPTYNPPAGSLNRQAPGPGNTVQGNAFDVSASVSGSTLYVAHAEAGQPADGVPGCQVPTAYVGSVDNTNSITYLPAGSLDTGCNSFRLGQATSQPMSHVFSANVGGTQYLAYESHNYNGLGAAATSRSFVQAYTGTAWNGGWAPQTPGGTLSSGSNTVTLSPFPTGLAANAQLLISGGTGTAEVVQVTTASSPTITFTANNSHSGAWTIGPTGFVNCWGTDCSSVTVDPKMRSYPTGLVGVAGVPVTGFLEENDNVLPHTHKLYVAQYTSGAWSQLGSGALNIAASNSHITYASQPATDGSGNVAICWTEEVEGTNLSAKVTLATQPQLFCKLWNGSAWSQMGTTQLNITSTDWSYLPAVLFSNGSWYVAFTENTQGGNPGVYVLKYTSGSNSWAQAGTGPLNINTSTGLAYHPTLATDGTNLYMGWEEQTSTTSHSLGYVKKWDGSAWAQLGSAIAADATNGSVRDVNTVVVNAQPAVAFAELEYGNLSQVYVRFWNGGTWATTPASLPITVPITVQEALIPGTNGFAGLTRTNDPLTVGIPIPDSAGITSLTSMGLTGASAAQFSSEATWPDGNIKWLKVRAIVPSVTGGGTATLTLNNSGSGNFGGSNLATDNGATITVNTTGGTCGAGSAICFTIKKANFNFIDQMQIGSTTVVSTGASTGIVVTGPPHGGTYPANVTCSPTSGGAACTTVFASSNDATNSMCAIEENGPAVAVLKCSSDLDDGSANAYMHQTTRLYFYQNRAQVKYTTALRNGDYGTSNTFATASKGFDAFEIRLTPNIAGTLTYQVANDSTVTSGTMSGTDVTYLYQAESNLAKPSSWCNSVCGVPSTISGYAIMNNGSALKTGTATAYPAGWADIATAGGIGVLIGQDQLAAYGNKSLEFRGGGSDVRLGLWAAENNTTSPSTTTPNAPYYQVWPQWSIHNGWLEFHTTAPASPANDHLMLEYPLIARASIASYNSAGVFPDPLLDPTEETNYYSSILGLNANPAVNSVSAIDFVMGNTAISNQNCEGRGGGATPTTCVYRYWTWALPGGSNQMEYKLSGLYNFIRRGFTGQYMNASYWYKWAAEDAFPMSDGFAWTSHAPETQYYGFPTATSVNRQLSIAGAGGNLGLNIEADMEHGNAQGYDTFYLMSGDETIKDSYMEAVVPFFANRTSSNNYTGVTAGLWNDRSAGNLFKWAAHLYTFLNSVGHQTDATTILTNAETVYTTRLQPDLCAYAGYPAGCTPDTGDSIPQVGTSKVRGVSNVFKDTSLTVTGSCVGGITTSPRTAKAFMSSRKLEGMLEFYNIVPSSWTYRTQLFDYIYGTTQWAFGEMMVDDGSSLWANTGLRYAEAIDYANACNTADWANLGNSQTIWYHWTAMEQYLGPLSISNIRLFNQEIQRNASSGSGSLDEMYHDTIGTAIYYILHPQANTLQTLPVTISSVTGGGPYTYNLQWTTPVGTTLLRGKYSGTNAIVEWIGFNAGTYAFVGSPATTQNWFASTDIPSLPTASPGTQTVAVTGLASNTLTAANFMVKALFPGGGPAPPPMFAGCLIP